MDATEKILQRHVSKIKEPTVHRGGLWGWSRPRWDCWVCRKRRDSSSLWRLRVWVCGWGVTESKMSGVPPAHERSCADYRVWSSILQGLFGGEYSKVGQWHLLILRNLGHWAFGNKGSCECSFLCISRLFDDPSDVEGQWSWLLA